MIDTTPTVTSVLDLGAGAPGPTGGSPFATPAWCDAWTRVIAPRERPRTLTATADGRVVGALPWVAPRRPPLPRTRIVLGAEVADYAPAVVDGVAGAQALAAELLRRRGPALHVLGRLADDHPLLTALQNRAAGSSARLVPLFSEEFPFLALGPGGLDEPALSKLEKRNDVRRRRRRLGEVGDVTFLPAQPPSGTPGLADFFRLHEARWNQKGSAAGLFASARGRRFVADVAAGWHAAGILRLSFVLAGDRLVAARFGVALDQTYYGMKSAFDPEFTPYGPGHLITAEMLRHALGEGVTRVDFMRGAGDHKAAWTAQSRRVTFWALGRGAPAGAITKAAMGLLWVRNRERGRDG
jgi:CelD/BcsL family acetyltransferase involved in cellulose biosynthesis